MSSSSSGFSSNSSSSNPTVVSTPENSILDQIAQYASQLAPQMLNWAGNVYGQTSNITDQAVNNFFDASKQMTGLAGNMTSQYNNLFAPENAQLVQEANSYASPARMAVDMGMAGGTAAQAGDQAIKNSEQNLLSYGIDPSAGRYAALDKAAAVQNAANVAGAENQQRMQDINTGQQLRAEAVQAGSLLPGAISNAENTAIAANTGASNATLANANTGANLMGLADRYLQTAMGLKLSPVGQKSQGSGMSSNSSSSDNGGGGGGGSGGGSGGGGIQYNNDTPSSSPAWGMNMPVPGDISGDGGGGGSLPDAGIMNVDSSYNPGTTSGDSGSSDFSPSYSDSGNYGDFAEGGAIPDGMPTSGGFVPPQVSPSGGAQTDDVNAHLNAGEFVVPKDVSAWKGQEFFHKLIADSRNRRAQMQAMSPVGPKPAAPRPGPVAFQSRRVA